MWLARVFCQVLTSNLGIMEKGTVVMALTTLLATIHKKYDGLEGQDNFRRVVELCDHVITDIGTELSIEDTAAYLAAIANEEDYVFKKFQEFKQELRAGNAE